MGVQESLVALPSPAQPAPAGFAYTSGVARPGPGSRPHEDHGRGGVKSAIGAA